MNTLSYQNPNNWDASWSIVPEREEAVWNANTKRQETKELLAELSLRYDNLQEKVFGAIKRSSLKGWNHEE